MAQILCKECGAANDSDTRFCVRCDAYLAWEDDARPDTPQESPATEIPERQPDVPVTAADDTQRTPAPRADGAARPPQLTLLTTMAILEAESGAQIDIEVRNRSPIVDAFRADLIAPPRWLTVAPAEVRVLPDESGLLPVAFAIRPGAQVVTQTVDVVIRVSSLRDTDQFAEASISLQIPPSGPPVAIKVQPSVVRLVDQTEGRVQVLLDNTRSNYPREITLAGSDDEAALEFMFSAPRLEVAAGRVGEVDVHFRALEIAEGTTQTRTASITATDGQNTTTASLTVNQARSAVLPLHLRLEPSVARTKGRRDVQLRLVIDNRDGRRDRLVNLEGRDPEGAMRFWFERPTHAIPAGAAVNVPVRVSATGPITAAQIRRPFSVVAVENGREVETSGTLEQIKGSNWAPAVVIAGATVLTAIALGTGWVLWRSQSASTAPDPPRHPAAAAPHEEKPSHLDIGVADPSGTPDVTETPDPPLSLPGTNAQGFIDYPEASCDPGSSPAALARTTKSVLVVCRAGPGDFYYRGVRLSDRASIELGDAVRSSDGFDVTNPADGTRYQIRPHRLTIITPSGKALIEDMVDYASI